MAKTIKFNLILDNYPVRNIEGMQEHFSIEDMLEYFDNGLLQRWLKVRGYEKELEAVNTIKTEKRIEIVKKLIEIFDLTGDEKKVEESVYILDYLEERKARYDIYEQQEYEVKCIIDDYEKGYRKYVDEILENSQDAAKIKATIKEIVSNYSWVLEMNYRELFEKLYRQKSYLAIMCLLMNEETRKYYVPFTIDGSERDDTEDNSDRKKMYEKIRDLIDPNQLLNEFIAQLGDNLQTFDGYSERYKWFTQITKEETKYMIISITDNTRVCSIGHRDQPLIREDIENKFVILDGIEYECHSQNPLLRYMEV